MIWLAVSIFASTVLLLVDRNHAWPAFWRFAKLAAITCVGLALVGAGYYHYAEQKTPPFDANAAYESVPCK